MSEVLALFHHIHHKNGEHQVHHCGGKHKEINPDLDYEINHCPCGKHSINKEVAIGHNVGNSLELVELVIKFIEKCPSGGWHVESGILTKK
ncbi:MAG: hypothetical protein ACWGHO_02585 [Candidatus Moraniibacteriota bacterium]